MNLLAFKQAILFKKLIYMPCNRLSFAVGVGGEEDFVRVFLKGALVNIKEKNPNLSLSYNYYKNSDIIQSIKILGVSTIEEFDLITSKIQELLANN